MKYLAVNILDMLETIGEDRTKEILSNFLCPINPELEHFVKTNSIEFAKQKIAITYLVTEEGKSNILGIFALAHKSILIPYSVLSKTAEKKIKRYAREDQYYQAYDISAFLIAQLSKNYAIENGNSIDGLALIDTAIDVLKEAQYLIGGGVIYLECEDKEKLLNFYQCEQLRFKKYSKRVSDNTGLEYIQLLKLF